MIRSEPEPAPPVSIRLDVDHLAQARRAWVCKLMIGSDVMPMTRLVCNLMCQQISGTQEGRRKVVIGTVEHHGIKDEERRMLDISMQCLFPSPGRYALEIEISIAFEGGKTWEARGRVEPELTVHGPQSFRRPTRIQQFHATAKKNGVVWMPVRSADAAEDLSSDRPHQIPPPQWFPRRVILENWRNRPAIFKKGADHVFVGASGWADVATIEQALEMVAPGGHIWLLHGEHHGPASVSKPVTIQAADGQAESVTVSASDGRPMVIRAPGVQFKDVTLREPENRDEPLFRMEAAGSISATGCLFARGKELARPDPRPQVEFEAVMERALTFGLGLLALIFLVGWLWALRHPAEPEPVPQISKVVREFYAPVGGNIVAWAPLRDNGLGGKGVRLANTYANHWAGKVFDVSVCQIQSLPGIRVEQTMTPAPAGPEESIEIWVRSDAEEQPGRFKAPTTEAGWTRLPFSTQVRR